MPADRRAPAARPPRRAHSSSEPLSLGFALYGYAFPLLGAHDFGGAAGRFGAGRSGHTHQGQDVMAACGTPLVAARGGRVQYSGYQSAAGNYIVIDGRGTGYDMAYMHLRRTLAAAGGRTVRTGQPIGIVGETGDASRLPPPLRDLERARLVRGRQPDRPAALPRTLGRLQLSRLSGRK